MNTPTPTIDGIYAKAWRYDLEAFRKARKPTRADSSVASWVVRAPWANPLWHSYALHLFHLGPLPGFSPPLIYLKGATHEIALFALDPEWKLNLLEIPRHLHPVNFGAKFVATDDAAAIARVERTVKMICDGSLSPDTDYLQSWIALYGPEMLKGDPDRAGETKVMMKMLDGSINIVTHDPKPP